MLGDSLLGVLELATVGGGEGGGEEEARGGENGGGRHSVGGRGGDVGAVGAVVDFNLGGALRGRVSGAMCADFFLRRTGMRGRIPGAGDVNGYGCAMISGGILLSLFRSLSLARALREKECMLGRAGW